MYEVGCYEKRVEAQLRRGEGRDRVKSADRRSAFWQMKPPAGVFERRWAAA
jgi:hypothetical protein